MALVASRLFSIRSLRVNRLTASTAAVELRPLFDTDDAPGGELHVPCGNRRESVCPSCSEVCKRDARQLVKAGLATFTAPAFGRSTPAASAVTTY